MGGEPGRPPGRKRRRGRPSKSQRKRRRGPTNKDKSAFVSKNRFLMVKRSENPDDYDARQ